MIDNPQSTMVNIKTIVPVDELQRKVMELWPSCIFVAATHEDTDTKHVHAIVRFELSTRWDKLAKWLDTHDPANYAKPARSWRRSVRYLLHMDNPEKARIPRSALVSDGIDPDELDQILGSAKMKILDSLVVAQSLPLDQRFRYLVEVRGHLPSEVSAALRCLMDLEKWAETRQGQYSALPSSDCQHMTDEEFANEFADDSISSDSLPPGVGFYD